MTARDCTIIVMGIATIAVIAWDVYVAFFNRVDNSVDTISGITLGWSKRIWALPYAVGVLSGHLFWARESGPLLGAWSLPALLVSAVLVFSTGWYCVWKKKSWKLQGPVLVVLGIFAGHFFWPQ